MLVGKSDPNCADIVRLDPANDLGNLAALVVIIDGEPVSKSGHGHQPDVSRQRR